MGEAAGEAADKAADLSWADVCAPTEEEVHLFKMKNELMLDIGRLRLSLSGLDVPRLNDAVLEGEGSIPHFAEVAVVLDKIESQSGGRVAALVTTFGARRWTRMPGTPSVRRPVSQLVSHAAFTAAEPQGGGLRRSEAAGGAGAGEGV